MIKIEVHANDLLQRNSNAGKPYSLQVGYLHSPNSRYPVRIEYWVPQGTQPLPPGDYVLDDQSFVVENGRLTLRPVLTPALKAAK